MNIGIKQPKIKTRIVDAIELDGRIYTAHDLAKILHDYKATEDTLYAIVDDFKRINGVPA